jgi:biopolymer transport protein ExbD
MRLKRSTKLLVEPPAVATGDIAFNLIVFFLVCASTAPDRGRKQDIPRSESKQDKQQQSQNLDVALTRTGVSINGDQVKPSDFPSRIQKSLASKTRPEDEVVVVKSAPDTPYDHWINVTAWIEAAGGVVTLQMEEEKTVFAN